MGPGFEPLRTYKPKAVYLYKVNGFIINFYCDNHYIRHDGLRRGSRNLVGIAIQLSDSEEEEFFVGYPMLISPEKFDFGVE